MTSAMTSRLGRRVLAEVDTPATAWKFSHCVGDARQTPAVRARNGGDFAVRRQQAHARGMQ